MSDDEEQDLNRAFIVLSDDDTEESTDRESSTKRQRKRQTSGSSTQPSSIQAVSGEVAGPSRRKSTRIPRPVPISTEGESSTSTLSTDSSSTASSTPRNVFSSLTATPLRVQVRNSFANTSIDSTVRSHEAITADIDNALDETQDDEPVITSVIEGDVEDNDEPVMVPNRAAAIRWQLAHNVQLRLYRRGWPSRVRRSHGRMAVSQGRPVVRPRRAMSRVSDRVSAVQHLQSLVDTSNDADIAARMAMDPTYSPPHVDNNFHTHAHTTSEAARMEMDPTYSPPHADNNATSTTSHEVPISHQSYTHLTHTTQTTSTTSHEVLISELEASAQRLTRPFTIRSLSPSYRRLNMANPVERHNSYNSLRDRITELRRELQSLNGVLSHSYELLTQIAYQHRAPPPVTIDADFLQRAPTKLVTEADVTSEKQCSICLAHYINGETMRVLPCDHEFHENCIDRWLTACSRTCPFCRTNIQDALMSINTEEPT